MKKIIKQSAFWLATIGAINWGLVGLFNLNLVSTLFGSVPWLNTTVLGLVGASGIVLVLEKLGIMK